ncbi:MAG: ATP-grasp domain-containing protein [Actinomycetota bacterium]
MRSTTGQIDLEQQTQKNCIRVAVVAEHRYLSHAQPQGMMEALAAAGHSVLLIDPEEHAFEAGETAWMKEVDVAVARGRSWSVLCLLKWLERQSVPVINSRAAIAAVHNKAEMTVALASAGIPMPRTFIGPLSQIAKQLTAIDFPVIVKPVFGDNCRGLRVLETREQLPALDCDEPFAIVQSFVPGLTHDLKLYCIGREVWAVRKASPLAAGSFAGSARQEPQLVPLQPVWRNLALSCGRVFGLDLFGVDCIETDDGPLVIEVNEFPNYSAVPGADEKLSNHVLSFGRQERQVS